MMQVKKKFLIFLGVFLFLASLQTVWGKTVPPEKNKDLYYKLQGEIVCLCGCGGLLIKDCFCVNADKIRDFLSIQVSAGNGEKAIKSALVKIHGEQVLAEPISPTAKIIIAITILIGAIFVVVVLMKWRKNREQELEKEGSGGMIPSEEEIEYDSRIDEELKDLDS